MQSTYFALVPCDHEDMASWALKTPTTTQMCRISAWHGSSAHKAGVFRAVWAQAWLVTGGCRRPRHVGGSWSCERMVGGPSMAPQTGLFLGLSEPAGGGAGVQRQLELERGDLWRRGRRAGPYVFAKQIRITNANAG